MADGDAPNRAGEAQGPLVTGQALTVRLADLPSAQRTELVIAALLRYREGEHIFQIAQDLGVSRAGLYRHILAVAPDQWREAKVSRALDDIEQAEETLRTARDTLETTRAREQHRAAAWMLERLRRDQFGQDSGSGDNMGRISITLNVGGAAETALGSGQVIDMPEKRK